MPHHADFGPGRNGQIPAEEEKMKDQEGEGSPLRFAEAVCSGGLFSKKPLVVGKQAQVWSLQTNQKAAE